MALRIRLGGGKAGADGGIRIHGITDAADQHPLFIQELYQDPFFRVPALV